MKERIPSVIYLQYYGVDQRDMMIDPPQGWEERTWCQDRIFDTDVPYIRLSKYNTMKKQLDEAVGLLEKIELAMLNNEHDKIPQYGPDIYALRMKLLEKKERQ